MTLAVDDRIRETTTTTGAGTYALAGAPTGWRPFSTLGANNYTGAFVTNGTDWEVGIYQVLAGNQLSRIKCLSSSNAGAFVNWSVNSGTKDVVCGLPAAFAFPRYGTKSVAGGAGTTVLTEDEQRVDVLELTGALTGNRVVEVSATAWTWAQVLNNTTGAFTLTLKVTGQTGFTLQRGRRTAVVCDGTDVRMVENVVQRKAADVAAAATLVLNVEGDLVDVTGNTGITAITLEEGREVTVRFTGTPAITDGASLLLPGRQSMTMAAGDYATFKGYAGAVVRMERFMRADGHPPLPRSYLSGYGLANNGVDATNDIDVAVGACRDSANAANIVLTSALTKQLDVAWAVGNNAGMLDTGAVGNNTYHLYAIRRPDTGVVDILASLSATAPTMPANYTQKRRIGSILREGAANVAFSQVGDEFLRKATVLDVSATNPGAAAVTRTLSVPTGVKVWALVNLNRGNAGTSGSWYLSALDVNDEAASGSAAPMASVHNPVNTTVGSGPHRIRTNTSAQIRSRDTSGTADVTVRITTLGWIDRRGRDD